MDVKERFGRAVKAARVEKGLSQEELAARIDADQAYVSRIEGGRMNVTLETADQIAVALEVGLEMLLAS
ncbi:MAG: helix-turn-helix transcriptional regulator [Pseudomonadota bacterium]